VSNPTPPAPKPVDTAAAINKLRTRLIAAFGKVSLRSNTQLRSLVDAFVRHLSPSMKDNGDSNFPVTIRPHKANPEATMNSGRAAVLTFHIGNAVLAYYDALTFATKSLANFEARVRLIEEIGNSGLETYGVVGDDATGYSLLPLLKIRKDDEARAKQQEKDWNPE